MIQIPAGFLKIRLAITKFLEFASLGLLMYLTGTANSTWAVNGSFFP